MANALKILFIPVSSAQGTGEYMRSLIIAQAIKQHWPAAEISFILSKDAPYATSCPFPYFLLNNSPTKEVTAVNQLVTQIRPDVTVFDCSGRASQVRHAKTCGSKVVFISQHKKKRKRGFSFGRLPYLDAHWITQFKFVDGDFTWLEKLKLALCKAKQPQFIGPVFSQPAANLPAEFANLTGKDFVLWAAGGGGHTYKGVPATEVFYQAAKLLKQPQLQHIVVTGANYQGTLAETGQIQLVKSIPNAELMTLVQHAKLIVSGGGDIMGQAIALQKNIVAIPVAKDQPTRIAKCLEQGLIYTSALAQAEIANQAKLALAQPLQQKLNIIPGLTYVLDYFKAIFEPSQS